MLKIPSLLMAAALSVLANPVLGQDNDQIEVSVEDAAIKIDVAGRQRMLSQRMAKAACLMSRDVSFATAFDQLTQAYTLFETSHKGLLEGDEDLGLIEESLPAVQDALTKLDEPWADYRSLIEAGIDSGTVDPESMEALDAASLDVLKIMNIAVFKTARAYASAVEDVPLSLAITVDVAGRQRMLTQKAVKEACLMGLTGDVADHAAELSETVELFDLSLQALLDGYEDVGVIAAPSREIDRKLNEVDRLWGPVKTILDRAAGGEVLSDRDLSRVASAAEPLMRTMNEAVGLYGK